MADGGLTVEDLRMCGCGALVVMQARMLERGIVWEADPHQAPCGLPCWTCAIGPEDSLHHPKTCPRCCAIVTLAQAEREHIERVLASTNGNISKAARLLDVSRSTIQRKLRRSS